MVDNKKKHKYTNSRNNAYSFSKKKIAFLKKAGYLERVGNLKTGHWIVVSK